MMTPYITDHSKMSFKVKFSHKLKNIHDPYVIKLVDVGSLYASILTKNNPPKHKFIKINKTPHFKFLSGDVSGYQQYLEHGGINVGYGYNHSVDAYQHLIEKFQKYLSGQYTSDYIVVESHESIFGTKLTIVDGVHRSAILAYSQTKKIPVAVINGINQVSQVEQYARDYKDTFREWYTPIKIGGIKIPERTYPNFIERPEYFTNKERGESKWNYIIKNKLPSLKGKRVYDIGCNNGFFSIQLKKAGAKSVIGVDRSANIIQPTNPNLPNQDVVQQAYFVKNLYTLSGHKNLDKVSFKHADINVLDFSKLPCDFLYATCILYHFGKKRFEEIIMQASSNIPEIFLQTNLGHHGGELGEAASIEFHLALLHKYGYTTKVVAPKNYNYPIIYGKKKLVKNL